MLIGNCKLRQRDITIRLLKWTKSRTLSTPNANEDVEEQELSYIANGNAE